MLQLVLVVSFIFASVATYFIATRPNWRVVELPRRILYIVATYVMVFLTIALLMGIFVVRFAP